MKKFLKPLFYLLIMGVIFYFVFTGVIPQRAERISYTQFLDKAEYGDIERVEINGDEITAYEYNSGQSYVVDYIDDQDFVKEMREQQIEVSSVGTKQGNFASIMLSLLISLLPFILFAAYMNHMLTRNMPSDEETGGLNMLFGAGKSNTKLYKQTDTGVKFSDVAGQEEAKESLSEIIDYLHNADKYSSIGAKLPKGALLIGPPGTGKTLLAKAVAGEANVPFYSITGSNFVEMFVGVGASRVRDMFAEAKKNAPCIIFIDEIDAIGKSRASAARTGSNDEREQTLNQLLSEMDGFDSNTAVVILAATNRPEILDKALTRPGRFDRRVIVDKPDLKGREDILKVHAKNVHMDESVDLLAIAKATAGGVGADLSNIINEAALRAVKMKREAVTQEDLMESVEVVFAGKEKKDRILGEEERKIVAYHEVGHAVVAALQKNAEPVQKITIVPRTSGALGYTMQVPEEEKYLSTKEELLAEIKTLIGGRCAEEVFFHTITTGASNDIEKITKIAKEIVTIYGMSRFDMLSFATQESMYLDSNSFLTCSEEFSAMVDEEMVKIVKSCHDEVKDMLINNKELVDEVAGVLLEEENITGERFMEIFRKYHDVPTHKKTSKPEPKPEKKVEEPKTEVKSTHVSSSEPQTEPSKPKADTSSDNNKKAKFEAPKLFKNDDKPNQKPKFSPKPFNKDDKDKESVQQKLENEQRAEKEIQEKDKKKDIPKEADKNEKPKAESQEKDSLSIVEDTETVNDFEAPPEQDEFETMVMEQMEFDGAMAVDDEPPMPDFDNMFNDSGKTEKVVDLPKQKEQEKTKQKDKPKADEKPKAKENKEPEKPKAKPAFEAPKSKPALEAPKPLGKKKKGKDKPQAEKPEKIEQPKAEEQPKTEKTPETAPKESRNDMALLLNSLKNNPEELSQKMKKGKYINPGHAKKENPDILTPDSNADEIKNNDSNNDEFNLSTGADVFSEDDY